MTAENQPEPWLRGTFAEVPAVARAVLHALQLAEDDLAKWCGDLSVEQLNARPFGIASVAFQIRHIARSIDRLLTYAEGAQLNEAQMQALKTESDEASRADLFRELRYALERPAIRIRALANSNLEMPRVVGRKGLPTTLGGLLVHVADHTQRHVGQAILSSKIVRNIKMQTKD